MKKKSHLQKIQLRLTIIFTLLVFGIASILQVSFFSYKYFSGILNESKKINFLAKSIAEKNIPLNKLNKIIKDEKRLEDIKKQSKDSLNKNDMGKIMNYAILDSDDNILIQNIRGAIDVSAVMHALEEKDNKIEVENSTIVRYLPIERPLETYQLLLFKQLDYGIDDYYSDMLRFFYAILIFSVLFLFIGYKFVRKNLKPVEENINEMNDFIHNAGHELKTPLSVIDSNLQLIKQFGEYKPEMINETLLETGRLNKLIEALVSISDIGENGEIIQNNIEVEINYILEEYKEIISSKNIEIKHIQKNNFIIKSDREYLYILLSNIIKNAIKFSDKGSAIQISFSDNKCIIQDFGIGIKNENIDKIFNRFFQENFNRNQEGFGIGLALVSKIAKIYNWKIKIESEVNQGTKFIIKFK